MERVAKNYEAPQNVAEVSADCQYESGVKAEQLAENQRNQLGTFNENYDLLPDGSKRREARKCLTHFRAICELFADIVADVRL